MGQMLYQLCHHSLTPYTPLHPLVPCSPLCNPRRQAKARAAREASGLATQEAAGRLLGHLDDLHERLGQLRVQVGLGVGGRVVFLGLGQLCGAALRVSGCMSAWGS